MASQLEKPPAATARPSVRQARRGGWRPDRQLEGYLFLLPSLLGFLTFTVGPVLAAALNQAIRGITIYRVIYFMPVVTSIVAAALVFQLLFNHDYGIISAFL